VFRICNKGALDTLSNQESCYKLGRVLDSPALDAKCNVPIIRACRKDVMGPKVKGEKWKNFEKSGANSQNTREQKTLPQLMSERQLHTTTKN